MSFFTRYCSKCGQPIKDGGDGHVFRCPPRPLDPTWPPTTDVVTEIRRLSAEGNDNASEMIAALDGGKMPSPAALEWYIAQCGVAFRKDHAR